MIARMPITRRPGDRAQSARRRPASGVPVARGAFSLIELLVVMTVVILITALMMPAMQQLHDNAQRVMCMAHLQQMGHAFFMYGGDHNDALPTSESLMNGEGPQDLMLARSNSTSNHDAGWDGMGRLFELHYCDAAECFYCPSHHGEHPYERYANLWQQPTSAGQIFTNYHYAGHMEWKSEFPSRRRTLTDGYDLVLATDGLRTASDFNHILGMNSLRGDGSVNWREDMDDIYKMLPHNDQEQVGPEYFNLWDLVEHVK